MPDERKWSRETLAVRAGLNRTGFYETAEPIFLNSGYVYDSAGQAEAAFNGEIERFVYSRYGNPTVAVFEERLRQMEGAESCLATSSGMAAVNLALTASLRPGDHLVAARSLFGSCFVICNELLPRWGVKTTFVNGESTEEWEAALASGAAAVFFETPSNPMQSLVDAAFVSELAHKVGASVIVDNGFLPVGMQDVFALGADVVVHSATKTIDGQGRVMGGAVLGSEEFVQGPVRELLRHTGPTMAPFNAWALAKGLETTIVRTQRSAQTALRLAEFLDAHARVEWVRYPYLPSHPQYELATRQMSAGGTVITFALQSANGPASKSEVFAVLDALELIDISNNFGDVKSLISHPSTTTHRAMGPEGRAAINLTDNVIRLSVGLEAADDLLVDLDQALNRI